MTPIDGCLSDERIVELTEGLLTPEELDGAERHLADCPACRSLVAQAALSTPGGSDVAPEAEGFALRAVDPEAYEVGREIAHGGMGRIFEAWDRRHHRRVAIKVLLRKGAAVAQRFVREIRVTSRLQHPAIVPLYEAGLWPDGEPFFAMRLVSGRPLAEAVAETTSLSERLALLPHAIAATEALAYAHGQGVVHRDLKPGNVLVGAFGETVVIDWGLAKELDRADIDVPVAPAVEDASLTVAGRAVGTPCYMAPEQARGEAVDARVDVYALGALLYHTLAGEPPFAGSSSEQVLELVRVGPPRPLEAHEPHLARDLLAIVGKAMARDPGDRYPTARAMAQDLRRFAEGRLVSAHRYTIGALLRRWIARYRAAVAMAAVLVGALVMTATVSVRRIIRERDRADQLKALAETKERSAVARRDAAEGLVEYMVTDLRERLAAVGKLDLLSRVGAEIQKYYDTVGDLEDANEPGSLARHAAALDEMAGVDSSKDDWRAAESKVKNAIALRERILTLTPGDRETRAKLSEEEATLARVEDETANNEEAERHARRAVAIADELVAEEPRSTRFLVLAAELHRDLSEALASRGKSDDEVATAVSACKLLELAEVGAPDDMAITRKLGTCYLFLGSTQWNHDLWEESLRSDRTALTLLDRVVASSPGDANAEMDRAEAVQFIGATLSDMGDYQGGVDALRRCRETRERLLAKDPDNVDWQYGLSHCLSGEATALMELGRLREARAVFGRAKELDDHVLATHANSERAQRDHVLGLEDLARLSIAERAWGDAVAVLTEARDADEAMRATSPTVVLPSWYETTIVWLMAEAHLGAGRLDAARENARASEAVSTELLRHEEGNVDYISKRARARHTLGVIAERSGDLAEAVRAYGSAADDEDEVARRVGCGGAWLAQGPAYARDLARMLVRRGDRAAARTRLQAALSALETLEGAGTLPAARRPLVVSLRGDITAIDGGKGPSTGSSSDSTCSVPAAPR